MKKSLFITVILIGFSISAIKVADRDQCFRESAQKLSDKGQTAYSNLTGLQIVKYKTLSPEESKAFSPGRELSSATDGEEESFTENGMLCSGSTVNEGMQYCKQPFTEHNGLQGCKEWGTIYKGSVCVEWGEEQIKVTVNSVNSSEVTNPEFIKIKEELSQKEQQMNHVKNIYDEINVRKEVEIKNLQNTLELRWKQVEQDWITKQSELLKQKEAALSAQQELELVKIQDAYHEGIESITKKWMTAHENTSTTVTTTLTKEIERWTEEYNRTVANLQNNQKEAIIQYEKNYSELEAEFASKMSKARESWREKFISNRNQAAKEDIEREQVKITHEFTTKTNQLLHKYNAELSKHTNREQNEAVRQHEERQKELYYNLLPMERIKEERSSNTNTNTTTTTNSKACRRDRRRDPPTE